jgi:uncharacterized Zn-binding protein involved in type VI secretion
MPRLAARQGDMHTCPAYWEDTPHTGGPIIEGSSDVFIEGKPAARVGDKAVCRVGGPDTIVVGEPTVLINGKPLAFIGSKTAHGGVVSGGSDGVFLGTL